MATGKSVPNETRDAKGNGSKPGHQGHPKYRDRDFEGRDAPVWKWEYAIVLPFRALWLLRLGPFR